MTCLLACELFLYHITGKHDKFSLRGRPNVKYEIQEGGGIICVTARGVCKTQVCRFAGLQVCRSAGLQVAYQLSILKKMQHMF